MKILLGLLLTSTATVSGFLTPRNYVDCGATSHQRWSRTPRESFAATTGNDFITSSETTSTIFDFSKNETIGQFDRIDDVIMGGISTSSFRKADDEDYATWRGVCRETGGGFCGTRTLPFLQPLNVGTSDGFYVEARLVSDDEPERRVWKLSTRTEPSRGEELYQAEFALGTEWKRIKLPFSEFERVRGARFVPEGPRMNVTNGIFQVGLTMSKFVLAENMTSLPAFRPGYFEVKLKEIGVYGASKETGAPSIETPETITKAESVRKRPMLLKVLLPVASLFFSEKTQRRKCAMKILKEQRGLSRLGAIMWGIRSRASTKLGLVKSTARALSIVGTDCFRATFGILVRLGLFYPILFLSRVMELFKKATQKKPMTHDEATSGA